MNEEASSLLTSSLGRGLYGVKIFLNSEKGYFFCLFHLGVDTPELMLFLGRAPLQANSVNEEASSLLTLSH